MRTLVIFFFLLPWVSTDSRYLRTTSPICLDPPFSSSERTLVSNANDATRKKNSLTFSPLTWRQTLKGTVWTRRISGEIVLTYFFLFFNYGEQTTSCGRKGSKSDGLIDWLIEMVNTNRFSFMHACTRTTETIFFANVLMLIALSHTGSMRRGCRISCSMWCYIKWLLMFSFFIPCKWFVNLLCILQDWQLFCYITWL